MATIRVLEAQMLVGIEPREALATQEMLKLFVRNLCG
jgi:hypothetical protein